MKSINKQIYIIFLFVLLTLFSAPVLVNATTEYQKCYQGSSCVVGEFLYDDSYVPIATADCKLTSRYPNGNLFVNSDSMTSATDGWYSYNIQATGSAGLYRSQICCTSGTDFLCLDKSFTVEATPSALTKQDVANAVWNEPRSAHTQSGSFGEALQNIVPSASDIATAVWGYSGRTLDNFGSLPSDVWNYTSRTITSFGDLIANIWNHSDRTLTSGGTGSTTNNYNTYNNSNNTTTNNNSIDTSGFAKKTDVDSLKNEVLYNQSLLEKLANKPVIKNFLEEEPDVNLESKLNQSQLLLTKLFADSYSLDSKLGMLDLKWRDMDDKKLTLALNDINKLNASIAESSKKIKGLWNLAIAENINTQSNAITNRISVVGNDFKIEGKSSIVLADIRSLSSSLDSFIDTLGTSTDRSGKETLYGKINEIKQLADTFDLYSSDADKLLADWNKYQYSEIMKKADAMADKLAVINRLPKAIVIASSRPEDSLNKKLKNRVLSIKATIEANKILIAKVSEKPFSNSWLEEGSVIFKTLLTNPSARISQDVPLKYYLPIELKKEDIISFDDGLKVNYDVEKKQYYVEGTFTLGPDESKVVSVRVEDIWTINEDLIASLRRQATDLLKPLEKTSYFGQGVTIKSNIDVTLDKILASFKKAVTPENKIESYYQAQIELKGVQEQIKSLQDLVTQAGSFGSMAGFIGGAQAIAVWGLIIIMVAGFVFLVIYMRTLRGKGVFGHEGTLAMKKKKKTKESIKKEIGHGFGKKELFRFAVIFFVLGSVTSLMTSFAVFKLVSRSAQSVKVEAKVEDKIISPIPKESVLGVENKSKVEEKTVTIIDLSGDYLRVRETPSGKIVGKAYSGEKYSFIKEENNWVQIKLQDGSGWISKEFILQDN